MVDLTIDSTIDGAHYIFGKNRNIFVRIFWICLFCLSFYGLFYYIRDSYKKWLLEPDILTKTKLRSVKDIPDPAITICPEAFDFNLFNLSEIDKKIQTDEGNTISREDCVAYGTHMHWCHYSEMSLGSKYFMNVMHKCSGKWPLNWTEVAQYLFETPMKFYLPRDPLTFYRKSLTTFGACVTFRMFNKTFFQEKWMNEAYAFGLINLNMSRSDWNFDSSESMGRYPIPSKNWFGHSDMNIYSLTPMNYACNKANSGYTFKVIVHQPNEAPTRFHPSVDANYNMTNVINIRSSKMRSNENLRLLHPDVRKCFFEDEGDLKYYKSYSKYYCLVECYMKINPKRCHPLEIPKIYGNQTDNILCEASWPGFLTRYLVLQDSLQQCKCYENCNFIQYDLKIESSEKTYNSLLNIPADASQVLIVEDYNENNEFVDESEKFLTYTIANFVADIGGYLGLFLGCSLISVMEIFFYIATKIFNCLKNLRRSKQIIDDLETSSEEFKRDHIHDSANCEKVNKHLIQENKLIWIELTSLKNEIKNLQNEKQSTSRDEELLQLSVSSKSSFSTAKHVVSLKSTLDRQLLEEILD